MGSTLVVICIECLHYPIIYAVALWVVIFSFEQGEINKQLLF